MCPHRYLMAVAVSVLTAALDPGDASGLGADWLLVARTSLPSPRTWFHYDFAGRWLPGSGPPRQAPCERYGPEEILRFSRLPPGNYLFAFLLDLDRDGLTLIQAIRPSALSLLAPRERDRAEPRATFSLLLPRV